MKNEFTKIGTVVTNSKRTIAGTEHTLYHYAYRRVIDGKRSYEVYRDVCNGAHENFESFKTKSAALHYLYTGEKTPQKPVTQRYYAVRLGFGHEGHGHPILVASADTSHECSNKATEALEAEFGGLAGGKIRDTYIGTLPYLRKNFPNQKGCPTVDQVIREAQ